MKTKLNDIGQTRVSINASEVLIEGESIFGRYQVEILIPHAQGGWSPAVMAIEALVTNYRLLLKPFRKKYDHASIPNYYIKVIEENVIDNYSCISIGIKTGHMFHMIVARRHKKAYFDNLLKMRVPKPKFKMDENVAMGDIQRLVAFFERWQPA